MTINMLLTGDNPKLKVGAYTEDRRIPGKSALGIMTTGSICIDSSNVLYKINDDGMQYSLTEGKSWSKIDLTVEDVVLMLWNKTCQKK